MIASSVWERHRVDELTSMNRLLPTCLTAPYHKARLADLRLPLTRPSELLDIPYMFKNDYVREFPEGLAPAGAPVQEALRTKQAWIQTSSGTTGERAQAVWETATEMPMPGYYADLGLSPAGRKAVFINPGCANHRCSLGKHTMEERTSSWGPEQLLLLNAPDDCFSMDRALAEVVAREAWEFQPDVLHVNPTYFALLLQRCESWGIELPPVRAILSATQFNSGCQRRIIESYVDCPVVNYYGFAEALGEMVASECRNGNLHLQTSSGTRAVCEVIRSGRPAEVGEIGYLVCTTARSFQSIVRFVPGDLFYLSPDVCDCPFGSTMPVVECEGRVKDSFFIDGKIVTPQRVDVIVSTFAGIDFYQVVQTDANAFRLDYIPNQSWSESDDRTLCNALGDRLGSNVVSNRVERLKAPMSGKFSPTAPLPRVGSNRALCVGLEKGSSLPEFSL